MAITALLYDVHGNLPALEAVLTDARAAGAERYLLGGDYALFGPFPSETVTALRALAGAQWIRGNVDRWCADPAKSPEDELLHGAIAACREALGVELALELGALPEQLVLAGIRFCHASPVSDLRSFMPEAQEDEQELLHGVSEQRLVFGHTHLQFRRVRADGVELVNPGSVGLPLDGDPRAAYALLVDDGPIELRRVAYDHGASADAVRAQFDQARWALRSERRLREARL